MEPSAVLNLVRADLADGTGLIGIDEGVGGTHGDGLFTVGSLSRMTSSVGTRERITTISELTAKPGCPTSS